MRDWLQHHPGSRPPGWWAFDVPLDPDSGISLRRQRIGGAGTVQRQTGYGWGIPLAWRSETLDPTDPPTFEGSARFLERLEILTKGELERVPSELFKPEPLLVTPLGWEAQPRNPCQE